MAEPRTFERLLQLGKCKRLTFYAGVQHFQVGR